MLRFEPLVYVSLSPAKISGVKPEAERTKVPPDPTFAEWEHRGDLSGREPLVWSRLARRTTRSAARLRFLASGHSFHSALVQFVRSVHSDR
jgi:hypothetical protein